MVLRGHVRVRAGSLRTTRPTAARSRSASCWSTISPAPTRRSTASRRRNGTSLRSPFYPAFLDTARKIVSFSDTLKLPLVSEVRAAYDRALDRTARPYELRLPVPVVFYRVCDFSEPVDSGTVADSAALQPRWSGKAWHLWDYLRSDEQAWYRFGLDKLENIGHESGQHLGPRVPDGRVPDPRHQPVPGDPVLRLLRPGLGARRTFRGHRIHLRLHSGGHQRRQELSGDRRSRPRPSRPEQRAGARRPGSVEATPATIPTFSSSWAAIPARPTCRRSGSSVPAWT